MKALLPERLAHGQQNGEAENSSTWMSHLEIAVLALLERSAALAGKSRRLRVQLPAVSWAVAASTLISRASRRCLTCFRSLAA